MNMAWQPPRGAPAPYGYDSHTSFPQPPHRTPGHHTTLEARPYAPEQSYGPPALPPSSLHFDDQQYPTPAYNRGSKQHSVPPTPMNDIWYDRQLNRGPPPSPWRVDSDDSRSLERAPSTDQYSSTEYDSYSSYRPPPTSSARGGRRPEFRRTPLPMQGSAQKQSLVPPRNHHEGAAHDIHNAQHQLSFRNSSFDDSLASKATFDTDKGSHISSRDDSKGYRHRSPERSQKVSEDHMTKESAQQKKDGDPLSILAQVSSEVDHKSRDGDEDEGSDTTSQTRNTDGRSTKDNLTTHSRATDEEEERKNIVSPQRGSKPPTSPMCRRNSDRSPLITPNISTESDPSDHKKGRQLDVPRHPIMKHREERTLTPKPITPTASSYYNHHTKPPQTPPNAKHQYEERSHPSASHHLPRSFDNQMYPTPSHSRSFPPPPPSHPSYGYDSREGSWEYHHRSPAVVEHNSFDSGESGSIQHYPREFPYHPSHGHQPPPPRYYQNEPSYPPQDAPPAENHYQDPHYRGERNSEPINAPPSPYPHQRGGWPYGGPPPPSSPMPGSAPRYPPPPVPHYQQYPPSSAPPTSRPPPPPPAYPTPPPYYAPPSVEVTPYEGQHPKDPPPPTNHPYHTPPPPHGPPHPMAYHMYLPYPPQMSSMGPPYPYAQPHPPRDEKTILRKKFSWKHFPELERFLIDHRDEYLQFSSRNYTVEQKQFNNNLTDRLIDLANKNNYVFDPEDFNFVGIRDRIRCYYKSYVQTARKRGMSIPNVNASSKKAKIEEEAYNDESDEADGSDDHGVGRESPPRD